MATWNLSNTKHHVLICNGSSCNREGAEELTQAIRKEISDRELDDTIHTTRTRCNGRCHDKCVAIAYPTGTWYKDLKPEDSSRLVDSLLDHEDFTGKISHTFNGDVFERKSGIVVGIHKDKARVDKVTKKQ